MRNLPLVIPILAVMSLSARAQDGGTGKWSPQVLGTQLTVIGQYVAPFHSAYTGPNSLVSTGDAQVSHTYGLYLGQRLGARLEAYVDLEMARGGGIGHAVGLAGVTNGDVIRQGSSDLGQGPYVARAFLRYRIPLGGGPDTLDRAMDQLPGPLSSARVEMQAGRFAVTDLLDVNRYANGTRLQFMNWGLINNTAWDYAADTRGYTNAVAVAVLHRAWSLRLVSAQMPRQANGNVFDPDVVRARGDNLELTLSTWRLGGVVRLLAYTNGARMGSYAESLAIARQTGGAPDIVADDRAGRRKSGAGIDLEQPVADSGETGVFARLGWNDGKTESFAFTEVERHASVGAQFDGVRWGRRVDRAGIAFVGHGLSAPHRAYLAAGGRGFLLGDGALRYGPEQIGEAYYRLHVGGFTEVTPDVQLIEHPGYNRDRGPAEVLSLRVHLDY